jgi:hypothetical protein
MQMLGGRSGAGAPAMTEAGDSGDSRPPPRSSADDFDDDIPF